MEVDQTLASAFKPGPSNQAVNLDLPPPRPWPTSHSVEDMEVDYCPALPPCLGADYQNASDQHSGVSGVPSKVASVRPKNTLIKSMTLIRSPPRINTQVNPMNLGFIF